jgi:hypoxanthine phosphoribosyltransferase
MARSRPGEVLIPADRLQTRVSEIAAQVSEDYRGRELLVIGVLKGAVFFIADLVRRLSVPCELDFMAVSSYGSSTHSSGVVRILKDLDAAIAGRHVLLVEDIIDSGLTLAYLMKNLASREPASLEICALLTKPRHRRLGLEIRYVGFDLPDVFAIGYGLDHQERFRELPHIAALELEEGRGEAAPNRP